MKKVLVLQRVRNGYQSARIRWEEYELHRLDFWVNDVLEASECAGRDKIVGVKNRQKIRELLDTISASFDVVYAESQEAALAQFAIHRKGIPVPPFVINDCQRLTRIREVCRWLGEAYGRDPYPALLRRRANFWFCSVTSDLHHLLDSGIHSSRLFCIPPSFTVQNRIFPDRPTPSAHTTTRAAAPKSSSPAAGHIVSGGDNNRDYRTLVQAAKDLPFEIHICCDPAALSMHSDAANVTIHPTLPWAGYRDLIAQSRFVVIPLKNGRNTPGIATAILAAGFGKPIIATDLPCMRDFVVDGHNGILVPPADPGRLGEAIRLLAGDPGRLDQMGRNSRQLSDAIDREAIVQFRRMLDCAIDSRNRRRPHRKLSS